VVAGKTVAGKPVAEVEDTGPFVDAILFDDEAGLFVVLLAGVLVVPTVLVEDCPRVDPPAFVLPAVLEDTPLVDPTAVLEDAPFVDPTALEEDPPELTAELLSVDGAFEVITVVSVAVLAEGAVDGITSSNRKKNTTCE